MQANYANALCHLNATPLSVAVLAPCAWGENLACGVAWQSVVNSTKQAQRIQCGKCLWAKQRTATRQIWLGKCGEMGGACGQSENGAVFGRGTSLSLSLSLSLLALLARLWAKFKGLFYLFYCSFLSSFCLQKTFFRTLCFCEIFKRFVFELFALVIDSRFRKNGGFCHFERSEKSIL